MTVGLVSLGCAKNAADLEVRVGRLLAEGWALAPNPDRCDTLIVNTCAFIASARDEAEREICRALALKRKGQVKRVVVAGCYPERYPERAVRFPGVDGWEGVPKKFDCQRVPGLRLSGKAYAYLKIAEGCAHRCAYCAIPAIRGGYRSRPLRAILKEARDFVRTGVKELNLIAQDPMLYGVDLKPSTLNSQLSTPNLVTLLKALDRMRGDFRVRVLYSYPSEITDEFLEWMSTSPRAVKYVDVPLQHTDPAILKAMARGSAHRSRDPEGDGARDGREGHADGGGADPCRRAGRDAPHHGDDGFPRRDGGRFRAAAGGCEADVVRPSGRICLFARGGHGGGEVGRASAREGG